MEDDANVQTVKRAYEAFQRGDIPAVLQMVTDDVDWELHGPTDIPFAGKAFPIDLDLSESGGCEEGFCGDSVLLPFRRS